MPRYFGMAAFFVLRIAWITAIIVELVAEGVENEEHILYMLQVLFHKLYSDSRVSSFSIIESLR